MKAALVAALALLLAAPVWAEEPSGCGGFAWNVERERTLLLAEPLKPGADALDRNAGRAIQLNLKPFAEAKLVIPPERPPKDPATSFAGVASFAAGVGKRTWRVSLSESAWIDVIQDGAYVASGRFTGARDCEGIRKSVAFAIGPAPFTVQISGATSPDIRIVLTPAE